MTSFEQAKKKARRLRNDVDYCREYEDAYVFSKKDDISFGGDGPVVILKKDGRAINMVDYCDRPAVRLVREMRLGDS